jgi:GDP-L-fucose synthase|uniref:GDP-L-fucose synthase family protein n=1 Tax=Macellibacteroides fermentans TaxID=879969 RepID=UPI00406D38AF
MEKNAKIYVCGHRGMAGSAIVRKLHENGYDNIIVRTHYELDLCRQEQVEVFFREEKPEYVFLAAAAVGGIKKNIEHPADMLFTNLSIQTNVIQSAYENSVKRLMFLGSSCIYPRLCPQPMKEEFFLTGPFEPTNESYAIAKSAGLRMCEYYNRQYGTHYLSIMPCNLYGINDHYNENAHVMASLIRRFHEAKINSAGVVSVWGSGNQRREFLFVDDMADAALYFMNNYFGNEFINVGSGSDISIRELAQIIANIIGYKGRIEMDSSKPDGMPQKLMDVSKAMRFGWKYKTDLLEGIKITYDDFLRHPEFSKR